jgi:hypothetical protein
MQLYLAWAKEVDDLVEPADLNWRDAERARFLATVITSALRRRTRSSAIRRRSSGSSRRVA